MDKRAEIEKRRNSWFLNKTTYNLIEETKHNEFKYEDKENCKNDNINNNDFLNRFSEKLSIQIRNQVSAELANTQVHNNQLNPDLITQKLTQFMEKELHTTSCKICYEVYNTQDRAPILLFPCGHTFCKFNYNYYYYIYI